MKKQKNIKNTLQDLKKIIFQVKYKVRFLYLILFSYLIISFSYIGCKNPVEEACENSCNFIQQCALKGVDPNLPIGKLLEKARVQCLGTCTMNNQAFLSCFEQSKDSCENFFECILSSGVVN